MKVKRIIFAILIILNCYTIFWFSSQKSEESAGQSGRVADFIVNIMPSLKELPKEEQENIKETILQPIVRKVAHYAIYTLLGIFLMGYAVTYKRRFYQNAVFCTLLGMLYAMTDEIHQLFTPGRSSQITDVLLDTIGVITGTIVVILFTKLIMKIKKEKMNMQLDKETKVLFISSTGGHFSELMQLKKVMEECNYYIVTEKKSDHEDLIKKYNKKISFLPYGTKKTKIKYIGILLVNCIKSLYIYLKFRPHVVITTGTHTAGPMCCIAKILGSKVIYIETFANRTSKTQAGKLLYYVADTFVVQWEEMLEIYPKAKYFGSIY